MIDEPLADALHRPAAGRDQLAHALQHAADAAICATILAGELEPHDGAVIHHGFRRAFDVSEQHVDRIVGVHQLEALTCECALADLRARRIRRDLALGVELSPDPAPVRVGDVLRQVDHHQVLGPVVDRDLVLAALLPRRVDLLDVVAGELALGARLAGSAPRDELGLEHRLRTGIVAGLDLGGCRTRLAPLTDLAAVTVIADRITIVLRGEHGARLEERRDGLGELVVGPARQLRELHLGQRQLIARRGRHGVGIRDARGGWIRRRARDRHRAQHHDRHG